MSGANFELRTLTFLDNIQPQLVNFIPERNLVALPNKNDAMLIVEIAPAMLIHSLVDVALKRAQVNLSGLITERYFGQLFLHHQDQGEVIEAGREIVRTIGIDENDRAKIDIFTNKIIRGIEKDHAKYFNLEAKNEKVVSNDSVLIIETMPSAYITIAANEALKAANVKLISLKSFGATGRLVMSGEESEIDSAAAAALWVLEKLNAMRASKSYRQLG